MVFDIENIDIYLVLHMHLHIRLALDHFWATGPFDTHSDSYSINLVLVHSLIYSIPLKFPSSYYLQNGDHPCCCSCQKKIIFLSKGFEFQLSSSYKSFWAWICQLAPRIVSFASADPNVRSCLEYFLQKVKKYSSFFGVHTSIKSKTKVYSKT